MKVWSNKLAPAGEVGAATRRAPRQVLLGVVTASIQGESPRNWHCATAGLTENIFWLEGGDRSLALLRPGPTR